MCEIYSKLIVKTPERYQWRIAFDNFFLWDEIGFERQSIFFKEATGDFERTLPLSNINGPNLEYIIYTWKKVFGFIFDSCISSKVEFQ